MYWLVMHSRYPPVLLALLALTHAGLAATLFLVVRPALRHNWPWQVDFMVLALIVLPVLVFWSRWRAGEPTETDAAKIGLRAASAATLIVFVLLIGYAFVGGNTSSSMSGIIFGLIVGGAFFVMAIPAVIAGFLAGGIFSFLVKPTGRTGVLVAAALATLSLIVPIAALVTHL